MADLSLTIAFEDDEAAFRATAMSRHQFEACRLRPGRRRRLQGPVLCFFATIAPIEDGSANGCASAAEKAFARHLPGTGA